MIKIYIIDGKNGAGKTFLIDKLVSRGYEKSVNYTTRNMRIGEKDGVDYHFIDNVQFEKLIQDHFFAEYQRRGNDYYGTPLENLNDNTILVSSNVETIRQHYSGDIHRIFIDASIDVRYQRVLSRKSDSYDIFDRFNTENYRFLTDFYASFIDNNCYDDTSFEMLLQSIENKVLTSNRAFLERKIMSVPTITGRDEMLNYLKYEEYLLRKLCVDGSITSENILKSYINNMDEFARENHIFFEQVEDDRFHVQLNNRDYYPKFVKEKVKK